MSTSSDGEFDGFMRGRWAAMVRLAYGLAGTGGVIAAGTIGGVRWQAVVNLQGRKPVSSTGACPAFSFSVSFSKGGPLGSYCPSVTPSGSGADAANPVAFTGSASDGTDYASYGQASNQVGLPHRHVHRRAATQADPRHRGRHPLRGSPRNR